MSLIDNGGGPHLNSEGCSKQSNLKLDTFDWLCDIPEVVGQTDLVEVTFKNTRKGYYRNTNNLTLIKGDLVAVEASPGHDIGTVSLCGPLVLLQMKKNRIDPARADLKRIYRKAKQIDLDKAEEVKQLEVPTMIKARQLAENLKLNMKIGDVEYQGDGGKAIFYYIAEERVDFRQLIKVLAEEFKVRIEMKQIGARQEAGRIGGIGPCGRPLCCASWLSNFVSVSTGAARHQDISPNPQKLAGQCAKLKCCMNFEVATYVEAQKDFPPRDIPLETITGTYYHFKSDILSHTMQYSTSPNMAAGLVTLTTTRVKEIIALNKEGVKVDSLDGKDSSIPAPKVVDYENVVGQDSLTRFDKKKKNNKKKKGNGGGNSGGNNNSSKQMNAEATREDNSVQPQQQGEQNNQSNNQSRQNNNQQRSDRRDRDNRSRDNRDRNRNNNNGDNGNQQRNNNNNRSKNRNRDNRGGQQNNNANAQNNSGENKQ